MELKKRQDERTETKKRGKIKFRRKQLFYPSMFNRWLDVAAYFIVIVSIIALLIDGKQFFLRGNLRYILPFCIALSGYNFFYKKTNN